MGDLTITKFNPIYDPYPYMQHSAPVAADLALACPLVFDTNGCFAAADADTLFNGQFIGLLSLTTKQYFTANAFRGLAYADGLSGLAYGALVWVSATAGKLTDVNPQRNEKQTLTITGTPDGGTFTLSFRGATTATIAYNASAANVVTALEALATIGAGRVTATGGALPGTPVVIEFTDALGFQQVEMLTGDFSGLTGGSSPTGAITESQSGRSGLAVAQVIPLWDALTPTKILRIF